MNELDHRVIDTIHDLRARWLACQRVFAESYFEKDASLVDSSEAAIEIIYNEYELRKEIGDGPDFEEYSHRFPALANELRKQIDFDTVAAQKLGDSPAEPRRLASLSRVNVTDEAAPLIVWFDEGQPGPRTAGMMFYYFSDDADPVASTLLPEQDDYRLLQELRPRGPHGIAWEAERVTDGAATVIKTVLDGPLSRDGELGAFKELHRHIGRLDLPGLLPIDEVGDIDGVPFVAAQAAKHGALAERLEKQWRASDAMTLVSRLCDILTECLRHEIVHGNLKPSNILFDDNDEPLLADFRYRSGIPAQANGFRLIPRPPDGMTVRELVHQQGAPCPSPTCLGKAARMAAWYRAPEAEDERHNFDSAADIYALGAILFQLLASPGHQMTALPRQELLRSIRQLNANVPACLEAVISQATDPLPNNRFSTPDELNQALKSAAREHRG